MRLKLTLARSNGENDDIVVTTDASATASEIATAVHSADPRPAEQLGDRSLTLRATLPGRSEALVIPPDAAVGDAWIGSGATIELVDAGERFSPAGTGRPPTVATARARSGPQTGTTWTIHPGSVTIGRDPGCDIVLSDPLVSKRHVRIDAEAALEVVDLGSANGVVIDGGLVTRLRVEDQATILVGDTELELTVNPEVRDLGAAPKAGPIMFNRSPVVEARYPGVEYVGPEVPEEIDNPSFPFLAMVAPVVMGGALFAITGSPTSLLFVAMSPLLLIGNYVTNRRQRKRKQQQAMEKFDLRLEQLTRTLAAEREVERERRLRESPATADVVAEALRLGPLLWTRRPEHWSFLNLRLGVGPLASRNTVRTEEKAEALPDFQARFDEMVAANATVDGVPLIENLYDAGAIGISGPQQTAAATANALLAQVTGLHSPAEVAVAALIGPGWTPSFNWLTWMPHTSSPHSPLPGGHLADGAASAARLVSDLEELIITRLGKGGRRRGATKDDATARQRGSKVGDDPEGDGTPAPVPAVVVLITDDVPVDRARIVQLAELAADAGVFPIWIAPQPAALPALCRTFVHLDEESGDRVGLVRIGEEITGVEVERLDSTAALDYARRMAAVVDAGALVADASDLPRAVSIVTLLGEELFTSSEAVVDRWRQNESLHDRTPGIAPKRRRAGRLRATVGSAGADAMHLDLRSQGPHALVGGTTGAGKSEFLQAWVLGMAAEYSPDRVTFLFVDYKGGSAFADCVSLPHTVGLVTDLSPHLVRRALTSLRAELHYREHLFNHKKAKDLLELEKRGDPDSPPALVLVIDEFAALAGEMPEFVDGVVDIAQRGRSLGIHLIMATQRPAGVIKDNLRANTNMRIALRMADESDSNDVVGVPDAGGFDPGLPGRGLAKTGPGRLTLFQSGYGGGWTTDEVGGAEVTVAELRFGGEIRWEPPRSETPEEEKDLGPTDQQRLVGNIIRATERIELPAPRRPWLDELAPAYDLAKLRQRTDAELILGVSDIPEGQRQSPTYFQPDVDGSLAIYGTGGSGKSTALRTLAAAAGITPRGGPVQVYGLDFGNGSLRSLEALPHVGGIINGDDSERIVRLLRTLKAIFEERGPRYAEANASSITEYRRLAGTPAEPRILLLVDGYPNFRDDWETPSGRSAWYDVFRDILGGGRQLGMHVALTADRPGAVPASVSSSIQRRVVLRLADDSYSLLDVPGDILGPSSPAGRAIVDGFETQLAVLGGSSSVPEQAAAMTKLVAAMEQAGVRPAPAIGSLPKEYPATDLPSSVDGRPVLGISELDLGPAGFDPEGTFLIAGPPASGRTNALRAVAESIHRVDGEARRYFFGSGRSPLAGADWTAQALTPEDVATLAKELVAAVADEDTEGRIAIFVEALGDFLQTPADAPLVELIKAVRRSDHLLVAEAETSAWGSSWPLLAEVKNGRRGLLLQPESIEGDMLLKTSLPRLARSEFPPGRGMYIARGAFLRVQLPLLP